MHDLLTALKDRGPIAAPTAIVVAHPDDEAIGVGGSLHLFRNALLVLVTDGAPCSRTDAEDYAALRRRELEAALNVSGAKVKTVWLGSPDQGAADRLSLLAEALAQTLQEHGAEAVFTHPYEGGHPDHDSAAFIVRMAAARMRPVPTIFEMASYHAAAGGGWCVGCFLGAGGIEIELSAADQAVKRAMFAAHASQRDVLKQFSTEREVFRAAPDYDFTQPPHRGKLLYERYDWGMTGAVWRDRAAAALAL